MNSGCSGSRWAVGNRSALAESRSSHRTSRAASHGASARRRRSTMTTCRTVPARATASSAVSFMRTTLARRGKPSAVISTAAPASSSRFAIASAPNPENRGSHTAPSFEHAITATTASGVGGRKIPTASSARTPSADRPCASRSEASRSSRYETRRVVPSSPSQAIAVASGVRSAQRSTQLWARFTEPPPNQVDHSTPWELSRIDPYGSKNSSPRSRIAASQNHSTSEVERSIRSCSVVMPWARISRVTFARSTTSGVGLHTNVTAARFLLRRLSVRSGARDTRRSRTQPMTPTNTTTPIGDAPASEPSGAHSHPHVRRVFLSGTAAVSAFITVIAAIVMGTYLWASASIPTIPELPPSATGSTGSRDIAGRCDERACNYLLLGSDSRKGLTPEELIAFGTDAHIGGENRSDTIILVHTRPDRREVVFVSFPRDLWVDIPGMGEGKINTAFEGGVNGGGPQRVARTIRSISGMQIHHVLYVNLLGFQRVVDALGGVDMCVPYPMKDPLTLLDIPAGCQHFDGRTALAYVRTRHQPCDTIPDFARISRQQQFLRAVIAKVLQPGELLHVQDLVPQLLGNLVVDQGLNPAELVYLAGLLQGVGTDNADFRALPTVPEGIYDSNGTFISIVRAVQPDADELLRRIREGKPLGDLGQELAQ